MSKEIKNIEEQSLVPRKNIKGSIYNIRGKQGVLNQVVKRNIERFPEKFRFQLSVKNMKI